MAPATSIEYLRDEWLDYLKREIGEIYQRRYLHDEFLSMLNTQDHSDTTFRSCFSRMYVASQIMAIRRSQTRTAERCP